MIALEDLNPWFKTRFTFVRIIVLWLNTISNIYLRNVNTYIEKYNNLQLPAQTPPPPPQHTRFSNFWQFMNFQHFLLTIYIEIFN